MEKKLNLLWVQHLKDETQREEFKLLVLSANGPLHRLRGIIGKKIRTMGTTDYDNPS